MGRARSGRARRRGLEGGCGEFRGLLVGAAARRPLAHSHRFAFLLVGARAYRGGPRPRWSGAATGLEGGCGEFQGFAGGRRCASPTRPLAPLRFPARGCEGYRGGPRPRWSGAATVLESGCGQFQVLNQGGHFCLAALLVPLAEDGAWWIVAITCGARSDSSQRPRSCVTRNACRGGTGRRWRRGTRAPRAARPRARPRATGGRRAPPPASASRGCAACRARPT